jgi:hypothetical protein
MLLPCGLAEVISRRRPLPVQGTPAKPTGNGEEIKGTDGYTRTVAMYGNRVVIDFAG